VTAVLAIRVVGYLAFDPTLAGPTNTLRTALGNLFAIGLMVGAIYYLFVARKLSRAITFGILGAVCAIFFDVAAIRRWATASRRCLGSESPCASTPSTCWDCR
jgi:hypothetical protein